MIYLRIWPNFHCSNSARKNGNYLFRNVVAQEYGTYLFRTHTYTTGHEVVPDEEPVIRF